MQKRSTFQIAVLCTFGGLAIAGVLIFSFFLTNSSSSSIGTVTVWGTFNELTIQKVLADMATAQPNLADVQYVQKDPATYMDDLTNALASGQAPDLFFLTQDQAYLQRDRLIMIPSSSFTVDQFGGIFIDGGLPFTGADGTLALPVLVDPLVLYWNKDLLGSAGFSQPPQYWDELPAFAQALTLRSDDGTIQRSMIALGAYSNVEHAKEIVSMLILQAGGKVTARGESDHLASALLAKSTGKLSVPLALTFYTDFANPTNPNYTWNRSLPSSEKAFANGTLALYIGLASEAAAIKDANPNLNFATAPVPQIRDTATQIDSGLVYGVAEPKAAKNPSGAGIVMQLLSAKDVSTALSQALGLPSARRDVLSEERVQPDMKLSAGAAIIVRTWEDPDPTKTDSIFRAMIEDTTSGALLLSEAIARAEQQINNLIGS